MKHGNKNYMQLSGLIFTDPYKDLSINAKWLFVVLNELEQRYTSAESDYFFRSNEEFANDCGFSLTVLKRAKAELLKTDLIESYRDHLINAKTGKQSEIRVNYYRVKK